MSWWHCLCSVLLTGLLACDRSSDAPWSAPDAGVGTSVKPPCEAPARGLLPVGLERVFPELEFFVPVDVVWAPHDPDTAYVVEYGGKVRRVDDPAASDAPVVLDLSPHMQRFTGELGLWDIAFHPSFPATPYVYAFLSGNGGSTDFRSILLRYTSDDGGESFDMASETVLLSIERMPGASHGGGKIGFSGDGLLWISTGDGDGYGDPFGRSQDRASLLGKMLRIDVDRGDPYAIPDDNPFAQGGGAPEVYALGFRNPWRWSFDRETGDVWVGDVGHHEREEIDRVVRGGNYGWNRREGSLCFAEDPCDGDGTLVDPEIEYGRDQGGCVTGGYVYRGTQIPELVGRYVFGDLATGRMWAYREGQLDVLLDSGIPMIAFAEQPDGELLMTDLSKGRIYRLAATTRPAPGTPAPYLSATGCIDDPRMVHYDVNTPLWSDGADKIRHVLVPEGTRAKGLDDGRWETPDDTILFKTFLRDGKPIETRLLIKQGDDWTGWSYRWFASGMDAERVDTGGVVEVSGADWYFPSTTECARCHTPAAGHMLGFHTSQLDQGTQLDDLVSRGVLEGVAAVVPRYVAIDDGTASLTQRVRSYLATNCSMCHRPGGPTPSSLDLRYTTPLAETNACDRDPAFGALGLGNARLIAPGASARSVLLSRMARRDAFRMPPLGTLVADVAAVQLIAEWIDALQSCSDEP